MARVRITAKAFEQLNDIPLLIRRRFDDVIKRLEAWPAVSGAKPLRGKWKGHFRMRSGGFRLIVRPVGEEVWIVAVGDRKDVYED